MKLSPHFTLEEMTRTSHNIANIPDATSSVNLIRLCNDYLEPLRERFGPIYITSGYRGPKLNAAIPRSSKTSAHCFGCAADLRSIRDHSVYEMMVWLIGSGLKYDQIIDEYRGNSAWLHFGLLKPGTRSKPRLQALKMRVDENGDDDYSRFVI